MKDVHDVRSWTQHQVDEALLEMTRARKATTRSEAVEDETGVKARLLRSCRHERMVTASLRAAWSRSMRLCFVVGRSLHAHEHNELSRQRPSLACA